jgi:hypothetical protein
MQFEKYQHVEQLGRDEVDGILNGTVYIFDKLDGSNVSVYLNDDGEIEVASRNRVLSLDNDHCGVYKYVLSQPNFKRFFEQYPKLRLFGEWLVPHNVRNYKDDAWRKLYIFDVMYFDVFKERERYLRYESYSEILEKFGIDFIPCITTLENPTEELVLSYKDSCRFLTSSGKGEGIVIKNYDFVNKYGRTTWAKVVRPREKLPAKIKTPINGNIESDIVEKYLTPELIQKEQAKIVADIGYSFEPKLIPRLLQTVWHVFISEELFDAVKKFHNPTINFKILNHLVIQKTKSVIGI